VQLGAPEEVAAADDDGDLRPRRDDLGAKKYDEISHREVLDQGLAVADATAFSLCMDNRMPIIVFNLLTEGNIARAVAGERIGTLVSTPDTGPELKEQP